ncbi:MAG: hypothetical protein PHX93_04460 [Candidatus Peribacteraceae bacterium]|nr:hypothetical protein [Candidatus Peribacteraceae bacterium]
MAELKDDRRLHRRLWTRRVHALRKRATLRLANCARVLGRKVKRAKRRGQPFMRVLKDVETLNLRANRLRDRYNVRIA